MLRIAKSVPTYLLKILSVYSIKVHPLNITLEFGPRIIFISTSTLYCLKPLIIVNKMSSLPPSTLKYSFYTIMSIMLGHLFHIYE